MSTENVEKAVKPVSDVEARAMFSGDAAGPVSLGQYWQGYLNKLRAGDVGSLPAVLGLVVLLIVFTIAAPSTFLTTFNLANLLTQAGAICVLAMGIGFVLLLGHIDIEIEVELKGDNRAPVRAGGRHLLQAGDLSEGALERRGNGGSHHIRARARVKGSALNSRVIDFRQSRDGELFVGDSTGDQDAGH